MPTLPNGFTPTVAAYSHDGPCGVLRTDVAGGAPRYGLDWDRGLQKFNVTLILDKAQFSVWTAFYIHIIKKGAITFDMPLDSGFGTELHACNIVPDSYSASRTGGIAMVVSFVVEAENKAYEFGEEDAQGMVDMYNAYGAQSDALMTRLALFANTDSDVLALASPAYSGPTLYMDFVNEIYRMGDWLPYKTFSDLFTVTRAGTSYRFNASGVLEAVAANAGRIDYHPVTLACRGLLVEETRTNRLRNNAMQGAVAGTPGTLPTNWSNSVGSGLSASVVGIGVEKGIDYIDYRIFGTATSAIFSSLRFETTQFVTAAANSIWTGSFFIRRVGGSIANLTKIIQVIQNYDSAGNSLSQFASAADFKAAIDFASIAENRIVTSAASTVFTSASTAYVRNQLQIEAASGAVIDITLRIGMPQLEAAEAASLPTRTTTAAVSRNADSVQLSAAAFAWLSATEGTLFVEYTNGGDVIATRAISLNDGTESNAIDIVSASGAGTGGYAFVNVGSVSQANGLPAAAAAVANTTYKVAVAFKENDFAGSRDGGAVLTDTTGTVPVFTRLVLGRNVGNYLNGYIRKVIYIPRRVSNAELQSLTA